MDDIKMVIDFIIFFHHDLNVPFGFKKNQNNAAI